MPTSSELHTQGYHNQNMNSLDTLLDTERQNNQNEPWNKLDKTRKTHILHSFSEKYGRDNASSINEVKQLKLFFNTCLEKGKLLKTKDVIYDREKHEINSIPALCFSSEKMQFTLKNTEPKRVSTLKSMTPKRNISEVSKHAV